VRPKILVVDDEADFTELLKYDLAKRGFEVFSAANAIEALNHARRVLPDVILLDQMLPDLDGASLCGILRCQPSTAKIPIVMISALDGIAGCDDDVASGIAHYFKKPVSLVALANCVHSLVGKQQESTPTGIAEQSITPKARS
jgi:DNA-binding response OmpR family regulator